MSSKITSVLCFLAILGVFATVEAKSVFFPDKSLTDETLQKPWKHDVHRRSDDTNPLETLLQQQAAALQALQTTVQNLQADLGAAKADIVHLKENAAKAVTFLAHFSADPIADVGAQATLRFDVVPYNMGGAYSAQTGLFTAPFPGVYAFFVSMMSSETQGPVDVQIVKSGTAIEGAYGQGKDDPYDQGSTLVAVHLTAGEQVWVRHQWGATTLRGAEYTVFSGSSFVQIYRRMRKMEAVWCQTGAG